MSCTCKSCRKGGESVLNAYRLKKPIPGLETGTVFIHDPDDHIKGSIGNGCLKNAWDKGNCQWGDSGAWCAGTHVFPGSLIESTEWFEQIHNDGRWHG